MTDYRKETGNNAKNIPGVVNYVKGLPLPPNPRPSTTTSAGSISLRPPTAGTSRPGTSSGTRRHVTNSALISDIGPDMSNASNDTLIQREVSRDDFLRITNYDRFHRDNQALLYAESGDYEGLKMLLEEDKDVLHCKGLRGYSLLHHAASKGYGLIISELIKAGIDVNVRNDMKETPLHLAVYGGYILAVDQLLDYGADIDAANDSMETCLFYAVRKTQPAIIRLLLQRGADVNRRDQDGDLAADHTNNQNVIRALVDSFNNQTSAIMAPSNNDKISSNDLLRCFSYLSVKDLYRVACVSTKWHRVSENVSLWKDMGVRRWEIALQSSLGFAPTATASFFRPSRPPSFKLAKKQSSEKIIKK